MGKPFHKYWVKPSSMIQPDDDMGEALLGESLDNMLDGIGSQTGISVSSKESRRMDGD